MIIGVPKEIKDNEYRVAMTPGGAHQLVELGHEVWVQTGAGEGSGFSDAQYEQAGAKPVSAAAEAWAVEMVVKVKEPQPEEYEFMRPDLTLFTYLHLAADKALTREMMARKLTGIAYETVELPNGSLPLLTPMSEVAGRMAVQVGAHYMEKENGGRGKLLSGVPGVRPADVVIIGAGVVGINAAQVASGLGAQVFVIDIDLDRLRYLDEVMHGRLITLSSNPLTIAEAVRRADLLVGSGLLLLLVLYSMITLNLKLTIVSGLILPFIFVSTRNYSSKIRPLWSDVREQNGVLTSVIQENLSGIRVVRGFSREEHEHEKFEFEVQKYFDINMSIAKLRAFFMPLVNFISAFGVVLIIWYGGNQVISAALSIGGLVAFYFYLTKLMRPVRMIGFMTSMLIRTLAAAERVFEIIDAEVDVNDKEGAQTLRNIDGRIFFEDVWFSYDEKNMVLKDIDLEISPGQTIAILGATGSGKSSIINLIPRFYDVTKGSIKIDEKDIRDSTIKSLRRHIGIVRQDPFIFSKSLRENIAYGVEDAKIDAVIEAAKQAKIHEFIDSLPYGYETKVGERGVTLSGGQKQRIAIARALLKNPKILILDDSTSSVDTQTEYEIQLALDELLENRTTFIITQRLSSIKKADYIVVLEDGKIEERGQHQELMNKKGIYYRLYKTQVSESQEGDI